MPATIAADVCTLGILETFPAHTEPAITLSVTHRANIAERRDGAGRRLADAAAEVTATEDGRGLALEFGWHVPAVDGAEGEWVYYERHTELGCVAHGWIDSVSRKLLQAG